MGKETHPDSGRGRRKARRAVLEKQISLAYLLIALFFISASLFTYQVALTRVFSPMLRYHFVFLVISVAIFGLGIGGYIAYTYARKMQGRNLSAYLAAWPTVLAAAFILAFSLIYKLPFLHMYVLYSAIATLPFVAWSWDAYSRTDVINSDVQGGSKIISIDGGSNSEMIQFDGRLAKVQEFRSDLGYLPFGFGDTGKVLLIGPGGGKDILLALLGGSSEIHAVEINSGSVRMARKYAAFNGNIYDRGEVMLHIQDGRNFVKQTNQQYDVIYLAQVMTEVAETVGYALAENYIYTTEAITANQVSSTCRFC